MIIFIDDANRCNGEDGLEFEKSRARGETKLRSTTTLMTSSRGVEEMVTPLGLAIEDWVDVWFEIQGELGVDVNWHLGWQSPDQPTPIWIGQDHRKVDGVGGFVSQLRLDGWPLGPVPASRHGKRPGAIRMIIEFIRQETARMRLQPVKWKDKTETTTTDSMKRFVHGFNERETQTLLANAKASGVSMNTFLLFHLNQSVQKFLLQEPGENVWIVPVNLRGPLKRKSVTANHVSFFPVKIDPDYDLAKLGQVTQQNIKRGCQWVNWYFINLLGRRAGRKGVYNVVKKNLEAQSGIVGIFTNLGVWPSPETGEAMQRFAEALGDTKTWFVSANNTPSVPVGGGAITWFGRLGISVQVHPVVASNQEVGADILQDWVHRLL